MSEPKPAPVPTKAGDVTPPPSSDARPVAWQPFTPRGIAAFAFASFGRLFVAQVIVAILAGAAVVWFLSTVWFPAVRGAIRNLPEQGAIAGGQLNLPPTEIERLVTNRFLTFAMDTQTGQPHTYSADVFVIFRQRHYETCSLFGCAFFRYPVQDAPFNRLELEAKWGAWQPILLGIAGISTALALLFAWWILATACFLFVWLLAFFADRQLTVGGSWRLCGAALLAGAVLLIAGIVGYGFGVLDLIRLLATIVMHVLLPCVLIIWAVFALPPVKAKVALNPFTPGARK